MDYLFGLLIDFSIFIAAFLLAWGAVHTFRKFGQGKKRVQRQK
jgi:hypothetical protein